MAPPQLRRAAQSNLLRLAHISPACSACINRHAAQRERRSTGPGNPPARGRTPTGVSRARRYAGPTTPERAISWRPGTSSAPASRPRTGAQIIPPRSCQGAQHAFHSWPRHLRTWSPRLWKRAPEGWGLLSAACLAPQHPVPLQGDEHLGRGRDEPSTYDSQMTTEHGRNSDMLRGGLKFTERGGPCTQASEILRTSCGQLDWETS